MRRLMLLVALAGLLGGCNMVTSTRPLFNAVDAAGAPQFRPGLWTHPDAGCVFDAATPAHTWPYCAGSVIVRPTYFRGIRFGSAAPHADDDKAMPTDAVPYVLAGAYPSVLQVRIGDPGRPKQYVYQGLRPTKLDENGLIIEARMWLVQCGPPEPPAPGSNEKFYRATQSPLPGLTMKGTDCIARDGETVLRAARASEGWRQNDGGWGPTIRWVRDRPK
jgi:hypothetical protein